MLAVTLSGLMRADNLAGADGCVRLTAWLASLVYVGNAVSALCSSAPQVGRHWLRQRVVHLSDRAALALAPGTDLIDRSPSDTFSVRAFAMES